MLKKKNSVQRTIYYLSHRETINKLDVVDSCNNQKIEASALFLNIKFSNVPPTSELYKFFVRFALSFCPEFYFF